MTKKEFEIFKKGKVELMSVLGSSLNKSDDKGNVPFRAAYYICIPEMKLETTHALSRWSPEMHKRLDRKFRDAGYLYWYGVIKDMKEPDDSKPPRLQYVIKGMDGEILHQDVEFKGVINDIDSSGDKIHSSER